jgi:hypothetical protein
MKRVDYDAAFKKLSEAMTARCGKGWEKDAYSLKRIKQTARIVAENEARAGERK